GRTHSASASDTAAANCWWTGAAAAAIPCLGRLDCDRANTRLHGALGQITMAHYSLTAIRHSLIRVLFQKALYLAINGLHDQLSRRLRAVAYQAVIESSSDCETACRVDSF